MPISVGRRSLDMIDDDELARALAGLKRQTKFPKCIKDCRPEGIVEGQRNDTQLLQLDPCLPVCSVLQSDVKNVRVRDTRLIQHQTTLQSCSKCPERRTITCLRRKHP